MCGGETNINGIGDPQDHRISPRTIPLENIQKLDKMSDDEIASWSGKYNSIYASKGTPDAATCAAGSLIALLRAVKEGKIQHGYAHIRPPGHHARRNKPAGFCIHNNVAIEPAMQNWTFPKLPLLTLTCIMEMRHRKSFMKTTP